MAIERLNIPEKNEGDELTAEEFNQVPSKINELVDNDESVKESIANALRVAGEKVGWIEYAGGNVTFYTEQGGQRIGSFSLSGTSYSINVASDTATSFYILTSAASKKITLTPSTKAMEIGGSPSEFIEDYTYTMSVDTGNGVYVERSSGSCMNGDSIVEEIRNYVSIGNNRIRFTITGLESGQVKSVVFTAIVTSLTLTSEFSWNRAFVEGTSYAIDGLFFSGKLQKTLYVKVDDDDDQLYTVTFNSGTSYTTTAYSYDMTQHFPSGGTGVHKFEIWMGGDNVETQHYVYNVICVAAEDTNNVSLVCMNDIAEKAVNYNTQTLFRYATYNATKVIFDIVANDGIHNFIITDGEELSVQTQTKTAYTTKLEIETEATVGVSLRVTAMTGEQAQSITLEVDNSNSYAAVAGADFYTNSSLRSNGAADRKEIFNIAADADKTSYSAVWSGFAWSTDGWSMDPDKNKCLVVSAGNTVKVPDLKPLASSNASSLTLEFKYRCSNVADYDTPVMSFMSTDSYDPSETNGIILFPTRLTVLTSGNRQMVAQTVQLVEDQILHVVIVLQRGYGTTGRNLCHIYVNGIRQCVFEYGGSTSFGNGYLKMGQQSADFYFYMMRYYRGKVFEAGDVMTNFLNTLIDNDEYTREGVRKDNDIIDGTEVSYELCKAAGYNCMVIEMADDIDIPSVENNVKVKSSVTFEYNDHPEWNVRIDNAPIDGQGTTSMRYYRWNVRWKLKSDALFTYADGTTETKEGYIAGKGLHPKVSKITAKKNYASSMQGHKIGGTTMYDELYERLGLKSSLPSISNRVAIYSYPFMGFQKFKDGTYKFIGLYTAGPDKGDKKTFGYDTKVYPKLLQIEGPNHAPLGTRFLHPWIDVTYSASDETLMFGGQEAWDVSIAPWETSEDGTQEDWDNILNLMEQEWRPAYEIVYFCSPYLRSLEEVGMTLDEINADVDGFQSRMDVFGNRNNGVLTLYDSSYHLIYYRLKTKRYEILDGHDVRTYLNGYLDNMTNPSTGELIVARGAKFVAEAGNYWSIEDAEYHDNFCVLIGATDNHAKNTYPFKFKPLSEGGRWCWKQDDLDSILATDNNGQSTKSYSVEVGDVTADGTDIYQGSSSVFWTLIGSCFRTGCKTMMSRMVNALVAMAGELGIQGATVHETVMNMFDYYFWNRTARYFPMLGYNTDSNWCYITPWVIDPNKTYNNVFPLTQALGTQYEAERLWVERRIVYVFSLFEIAAFTGSSDDGMGKLEFTPAKTFNFEIVPAIDMYPSGNIGGGQNVKGERTLAGETCLIAASSDGQTTYYLKAVDWYTSIGDLCRLTLTSRGGDATVGASFAVSGNRLRVLKIGDADASNVAFNASTLAVSGASLEEIDARNVVSLKNDVRLLGCPRLKRVLFEGTNVPTLLIPMGAKVEEVSYPTGMQTLFLHTLPLLTMDKMLIPDGSLTTINGVYYYECPNLSPFDILRKIFHTEGNSLQFLTMIWTTPVAGTSADLDMLATFTEMSYDPATGEGYGSVEFDQENMLLVNSSQHPVLEGVINVDGYAYEDSVTSLRDFFGSRLELNVSGYYIRFKDKEWLDYLATKFGDGVGTIQDNLDSVTTISGVFETTEVAENCPNIDILDMSPFQNISTFYYHPSQGWNWNTTATKVYFRQNRDTRAGSVNIGQSVDGVYKYVYGFSSVNHNHGYEECVVIENCTSFMGYFFRDVTYNNIYIKNDVMMTGGFSYASNPTNTVQGFIYVQASVLEEYLANENWAKHSAKLKAYDFDADPDNILPEHTGYFAM